MTQFALYTETLRACLTYFETRSDAMAVGLADVVSSVLNAYQVDEAVDALADDSLLTDDESTIDEFSVYRMRRCR